MNDQQHTEETFELPKLGKRGNLTASALLLIAASGGSLGTLGLLAGLPARVDTLEREVASIKADPQVRQNAQGVSANRDSTRANKAEVQRIWDRIGGVEKDCNEHFAACAKFNDKLEDKINRLDWRIQRYHNYTPGGGQHGE